MKKIIIAIISVIVVVLVSIIAYLVINPKAKVVLLGNNPTYLEVNSEYKDSGIEVYVKNKKIKTKEYKIVESNDINNKKIGKYTYSYEFKYKYRTYKLKRKVEVVDKTKPEIKTNIDTLKKDFCNNKEINTLEYTASDNYDGDLTENVEKEETDEKVILKVKDSSKNEATKEVPIEKTKAPNPIIKLNGTSTTYVVKGNKYTDQGTYVLDGCTSKKIDAKVTTEGSVDTNKVGTYTLKYKTTVNNMEGTATRKVQVVEKSTYSKINSNSKKVVYLTFDDGPGAYTKELLNILDKYNVKVTFFVTNQFSKYQYLIKEEYNRGHVVAVHSYSHAWSIYNSVEAYEKDFNKMNDIIYKQTGTRSNIYRFPGGSSNTVSKKYSIGVVSAIASDMNSKGYVYFDWNVDSEDAAGAGTDKAYNNVINGIKNHNNSVVLMHDIHKTTIPAVEKIIKYGIDNGYTFKTLSTTSPTVQHKINN